MVATAAEAGGEHPFGWPSRSPQPKGALVTQLTSAVANEYRALIDEAHSAQTEDEPTKSRILARLRRELRRVGERAYFPPPERQEAREAIEALATTMEAPE